MQIRISKCIIIAIQVIIAMSLLFGCDKNRYTPQKPQSDIDKPSERPSEPPFVPAERVEGKVSVAYVTWYGSTIPDYTYITNINYAFAELYVVNGVYRGFKLSGKESRFESIVALKKKYPGLKISISFSHVVENSDNQQGGGFSALARSAEYREKFAQDCKAFLERWGIDGIDIDWEFPGLSWSGHACDPAVDVENHVLLMKQLRETLGDKYLLTYAGYAKDRQSTTGGYRYIDIKSVDKYVDFVNVMSYDMDEAPRHHSALSDMSAYIDCKRAIEAYTSAGISPNKIVLGIPFFGRRSFSNSPTSISYRTIIALGREYKIDNWDSRANVPFVTYNGQFYCGYDNPKSIAIKGEWCKSLGLKGMMFWEYDGDDTNGTLRKAVWNAVMQ